MKVENFAHGGNISEAARKYNLSERQIIDFSASINPLGPSPGIYQQMIRELWRITHYPDPESGNLPGLLAEYLGVDRENILLGNGGAEMIYLLPRALQIKKAMVLAPTFSLYAKAVESAGGAVKYEFLPLEGEVSLVERLEKQWMQIDALFICNPNNPTGRLFPPGEMQSLLPMAEKTGTWIVVDEAFMDFVEDRQEHSLMPLVKKFGNLMVLYSMTKFFGFPGLRLGAAVASATLIEQLKLWKDPWSVNVLAKVAGEAALKDQKHREDTLDEIKKEKEYLSAALSTISGFTPFPSDANFLLADISGTGFSSTELTERMARSGVLIRDCSNFNGLDQRYIRLAVRSRSDNEALIKTLEKVLFQ